jgi:DNA-binding MarR family transcriptional regulator
MSDVLLSAFNPSTMSPELLEGIFVEREPLAQELLQGIRDSLAPDTKRHSLLVGPRGMGKTHLVSLIYHRIREGRNGGEGLDTHLRIAWLREEERGVAHFFHLLRRILVTLAKEYNDDSLHKSIAELGGRTVQEAQPLAECLLVSWLGDKTLLLFIENFEDILDRLGNIGQQSFRAFLQTHSKCIVFATAPSLTLNLSKHSAPFYNFFNIRYLGEFDVPTAASMMRLIAEKRGDTELREFLDTPVAKERLQAIEDLAGGHPRIWILFAGFLTRDALDELVPAFFKLVDELTPYYQAKMAELPPQEALIVEYLCERPGAQTVKEIAEGCFLAQNAAAAQLGNLSRKAYVRSEKVGRESYYELREPLLRIWIQVKGDRDQPVRLLIEFIKRWFTLSEIGKRRDSSDKESINFEYYKIASDERYNNYLEFLIGKCSKLSPIILLFDLINSKKINLEEFIRIYDLFFRNIETEIADKMYIEIVKSIENPSYWSGNQSLLEILYNDNYEAFDVPGRMVIAFYFWYAMGSRVALLRLEPELRSKLEQLLPPEASQPQEPAKRKGRG